MTEYKSSFKLLRDFFNIALFVVAVVAGAFLLNSFVFQSYNVYGASMEPSLQTGNRLIINKIPVTWKHLGGQQYKPERGQIIVFKNPLHLSGEREKHLIKRVVAFGGERVVVQNGRLTVYNKRHPNGFDPSSTPMHSPGNPKSYTSGEIDTVVPKGEIFVAGDNRTGNHSLDSRNGLGAVPLKLIEGPAYARVYPFSDFTLF